MRSISSRQKRITKQSLIYRDAEERLRKERLKIGAAIATNLRLTEEMDGDWQERGSPSEDEIREVEYRHRESLQTHLRDIEDALERMKHTVYGLCVDCGKKIGVRRLMNDLAVSRCLVCQKAIDGNTQTPTL